MTRAPVWSELKPTMLQFYSCGSQRAASREQTQAACSAYFNFNLKEQLEKCAHSRKLNTLTFRYPTHRSSFDSLQLHNTDYQKHNLSYE